MRENLWVLIKACVNGPRGREAHPALPVTAEDLATDVLAVAAAGADAVHLHVKDSTGADTLDAEPVAEVLNAVRRVAPGMPLGVTTGAWALPNPEDRVAAVRSWTVLPDFASVNWHETGAEQVAAALLERGIGVEAGLWHDKALNAWQVSPLRDDCLRVLLELPDGLDEPGTVQTADRMLAAVHRGPIGSDPRTAARRRQQLLAGITSCRTSRSSNTHRAGGHSATAGGLDRPRQRSPGSGGFAADPVPPQMLMSIRTTMAAAFMTHLSQGAVDVLSGGSEPADRVNPAAVAAMAEVGIDIATEQPKILTAEAVKASDVVVTMGCGDTCPFYPGKRYEDWVLEDPAGKGVDDVRPIRDEIRRRVESLMSELVPTGA